ncbi:LysR family transcriptional regulator [Novosphingobium sp. Rr 2-17]|uniref:LysR family transcriptional regulator n=1 Tax=Novosphingobium sp. Rr 2-17 TaxID=555793 RepID=UPI0002698EDF|nr:LysR family transcriptional regulator [Novosphingobium sp. Rr 2-17]EIZ79293.1 LysR family transcriptional regulator [Novosphingobium sp. Rr 2-17]
MAVPPRRLPQLSTLRVFEVAARHQNLLRAAEELNVTHGAVSRQVRALEAELGEPLFERRNRGVHLNDRGKWLSTRLSEIFVEIEGTFQDFRAHSGPRPLIVSCEPTLCLKLLIPSISQLERQTGLDVRYMAAGGPVDFSRDHVDLAIRRNDFLIDHSLFVADLAEEEMGPVASPSFLDDQRAATGKPDLLHAATRPKAWRDWKKRAATPLKAKHDVLYEHHYLAIQAAEAGQGFALASVHMVARDLHLGRLKAPYGFIGDGTKYVALSPTRLESDPRKDTFVEWLRVQMARNIQDGNAAHSGHG